LAGPRGALHREVVEKVPELLPVRIGITVVRAFLVTLVLPIFTWARTGRSFNIHYDAMVT
jgi:hypothetical protein